MLTAVSSQHLVINASYVLLPNTVITHGGCESHFCGFHSTSFVYYLKYSPKRVLTLYLNVLTKLYISPWPAKSC